MKTKYKIADESICVECRRFYKSKNPNSLCLCPFLHIDNEYCPELRDLMTFIYGDEYEGY